MSEISLDKYTIVELQSFTHNFALGLQDLANGKTSDFSYLNTLITKPKLATSESTKFQVMTIGGTNFLKSIATYTNQNLSFTNQQKLVLPTFTNRQIFLDFIISQIEPELDVLAIDFGYPVESLLREDRLDAVLLKGTKDHTFKGLIGCKIGQELESFIHQKTGRRIKITLANDVVCLLVSEYSNTGVAACIVGTGYNLGFLDSDRGCINLESGNFASFRQSDTGIIVDNQSTNSGAQIFEKEVSGAYLYRHYNILAQKYDWMPVESTVALDELARHTDLPQSKIAHQIFQRSASLVATQIAGLYQFKAQEKLTIVMQGGVYWKVDKYPEYLQNYLNLLGMDLSNIDFVEMDNPFVGVARLVV